MRVRERIDEILADDRLDQEEIEESKTEAIEALVELFGWASVRDCMMDVLRDNSQESHWRTAADVFWGAALDKRDIPADELIALLYYRFDPDGQAEDNLVWSIASELKAVSYMSSYEPLRDPEVAREFQKIRDRG